MEVVDIGSLGTGGAVVGGAVPAEVGALQVGDQESRAVVYPDFQVFYFSGYLFLTCHFLFLFLFVQT